MQLETWHWDKCRACFCHPGHQLHSIGCQCLRVKLVCLRDRHLPNGLAIIGYARSKLTDDSLREKVKPHLKGGSEEDIQSFLEKLSYVPGSYDQAPGYQELQKAIKSREQSHGKVPLGRLFYLALPPSVYLEVCFRTQSGIPWHCAVPTQSAGEAL